MAKVTYYEKGRIVVNENHQRSIDPADLWGCAAKYHIGVQAIQLDPQLEMLHSEADDGEEQMFSVGPYLEKLGLMDTPHVSDELEMIARRNAEAEGHHSAIFPHNSM